MMLLCSLSHEGHAGAFPAENQGSTLCTGPDSFCQRCKGRSIGWILLESGTWTGTADPNFSVRTGGFNSPQRNRAKSE